MAQDYLPRINVTLNDLGLKVGAPPAGPKVTLLGVTSNPNITLREPFTVTSVDKAISSLYFNFGGVGGLPSDNVPGELALAVEEASAGGATNIEVMAIAYKSGQSLIDYVNPYGDIQGDLTYSGRFADLSGAYDVLRNRDLDVVVPVGAYIDQQFTGSAAISKNFGKQLADFCYQATKESNACHGVISVRPPLLWAARYTMSGATLAQSGILVKGGSTILSGEVVSMFSGSFKGDMANVLFGTPSSSLLGEWHAYHTYRFGGGSSLTAVTGASYSSTVYDAWLKGATDQNGAALSNVDVSTATSVNTAYLASWQAIDSQGVAATDSKGNKVDAGAYLSVVAFPIRAALVQTRSVALTFGGSIASTSVNTDGAAAYAGLINSLAPQSATTNKVIPGVVNAKLLSAKQANDMTGMRLVTVYNRSKGLVVAKGLTGAYNVTPYVRSDYVNLTTVRITHAAVDIIRALGEKYIGEPNNAPQLNALDAEIEQALLTMKNAGAINAYQFSISATPDQRVLGQLDINLTLVPAFEIQQINLTVSLAKSL